LAFPLDGYIQSEDIAEFYTVFYYLIYFQKFPEQTRRRTVGMHLGNSSKNI